jgi:trehalose 6-phosphate synthase
MRRLRQLQRRDSWNAKRLKHLIDAEFRDESIVVLANRAPFRHDRAPDGSIVVKRSSGGLVTALEPLIEACAGVWVAHGSGSADRMVADAQDGVSVPPARPRYRLRHVWLQPHEERGYYDGFANEGLWPLCHRASVPPTFRSTDFEAYRVVNDRFADAVCEEASSDEPLVLVQDYHFALAPGMIRERLPLATIVAFWHIPWPRPSEFALCPWRRELVEGLLGSSVVGFQTPEDCQNFFDTAEIWSHADVDRDAGTIAIDGRSITVRAYPVSVEWPCRWPLRELSVPACRAIVRERLGLAVDTHIGVGIDRLDYTKGINEKFLAVERLLDNYPSFRERFVFVQVAEPTRERIAQYRNLHARVRETADRINRRFGTQGYQPIMLLDTRHEPADVYRLLRAADLCFVGSLHDGMNLVAKEFVSARDDEQGVLVLSAFAGASRELSDALIVDPRAIEDGASAMAAALTMSPAAQAHRMRAMRAAVENWSSHRWAAELLMDAARARRAAPTAEAIESEAGEALASTQAS